MQFKALETNLQIAKRQFLVRYLVATLKQQEQAVIVISVSNGSINNSGLAIKSSAEFLVSAGQCVPGIVADCCR